jgi:threonine aldolase
VKRQAASGKRQAASGKHKRRIGEKETYLATSKSTNMSKSEVKARCTRFLSGHKSRTVREWFALLAESPLVDLPPDSYGEGEAINSLEREVAALVGKEAGVFVMKGMIAQMAALRVWTDRSGARTVALHPRSHFDLDEGNAYERLHSLQGIRIGAYQPFLLSDLEGVAEKLGVVTVELPLRRAGFRLLEWSELSAISDWCRERNVPLHFDGARLWQCGSFYEHDYSEIAALADSVYVSFYKDLGALAGCVLAGPADFIRECKVWQMRHGGNLFTAFPYVLAAQEGLREHLPRMGAYYARAQELAACIEAIPGVHIAPSPPHTNAFQIYLPGQREALEQAALEVAQSAGVWLFGGLSETALPDVAMGEIQIGNAAKDLANEEVVALLGRTVELAQKKTQKQTQHLA